MKLIKQERMLTGYVVWDNIKEASEILLLNTKYLGCT